MAIVRLRPVALLMVGLLASAFAASAQQAVYPPDALPGEVGDGTVVVPAADPDVSRGGESEELRRFLDSISLDPLPAATLGDDCGCRTAWAACHDFCAGQPDEVACGNSCFADLTHCLNLCWCCVFPEELP